MDLNNIKAQMDLAHSSIEQMNSQNRIFENILSEAVKGAPESDKKQLDFIRLKSNEAIRLAKDGKAEEAQKIIKEIQNYGG